MRSRNRPVARLLIGFSAAALFLMSLPARSAAPATAATPAEPAAPAPRPPLDPAAGSCQNQSPRALAGVAIKSANRPQRCRTADGDTEQTIKRVASIRLVRAGDDTPLLAVPVLDEVDKIQTVGRICLANCPDVARADGGHGSQPV